MSRIARVLALAVAAALPSRAIRAQESLVHTHILHVADAIEGTPGGVGLLPIAMAEGQIAALHAGLAADAVNSVDDIRLHVGHVMHAIEPFSMLSGPGVGFGLRRAAAEAVTHLETIAADSTASDNARTHVNHLLPILRSVVQQADQILALAQQLQMVPTAAAASSLAQQLDDRSQAMVFGRDIDRDGIIAWHGGEGGLRQAVQHLTLLKRGEGLIGRLP